ncbi:MAG TPA: hypothetical protein VHE30_11145 [Polyangiaceae bacterium]|nr:hypothetical protein [Polyangiaceae bacterium]
MTGFECDGAATTRPAPAGKALDQARAEAPTKVSADQMGCYCAKGHQIVVTCRVTSNADIPVDVQVSASAQTGFTGTKSAGSTRISLAPHTQNVQQIQTSFNGLVDCTSATACTCSAVVTGGMFE